MQSREHHHPFPSERERRKRAHTMADTVSILDRVPAEIIMQVVEFAACSPYNGGVLGELASSAPTFNPWARRGALYGHDGFGPYDKSRILSLMLVCTTFYKVALPLFYEFVVLGCGLVQYRWTNRRFVPGIRTLSGVEHYCSLATSTAGLMKNIKSLRVDPGDLEPQHCNTTAQMFALLRLNPGIQHFDMGTLRVHQFDLAKQLLQSILLLKNLKSLSLKSFRSPWDIEESWKLNPDQYGTASFTSLDLTDFRDSRQMLHTLLAWPRGLEQFKFSIHLAKSGTVMLECQIIPNLSSLRQLLLSHQRTLKSLSIGRSQAPHVPLKPFSNSGNSNMGAAAHCLDLTDFTSLEWLDVTHVYLDYSDETDEAIASGLLAPNLRTFVLYIGVGYHMGFNPSEYNNWSSIDGKLESFLIRLARLAEQKKTRLRHIRVAYVPTLHHALLTGESSASDVYPWIRLARIQKAVRGYGIDFTFPFPHSTHEYAEMVALAAEYASRGIHLPGFSW
ncbi:hypothetical protein B0T17DRAFT_218158 [Bombardia bombarda]|uniref:Uncharacterized protein n=1 Tax=Bombardia bombarda TaxID=252184 RepID=A0AA40CAB2_9PEZI|nr:hypothetical protein B0T17DRAFT_218158 [Bombardia bombarda]